MKLGSFSKMLAGTALALMMTGGVAMARPAPMGQPGGQKSQKKKSLYPNATRKAPKLDLHSQDVADQLNKGLDAVNAGNTAKAVKLLKPLADGKKGNSKYAQAIALQGLANVKYHQHDLTSAIQMLQKALKIGVMPNDSYFQIMYELAQFYANNNQDQKALDTIHKWRKEGQRQTADSYGLEGVLDYRLKKYKQAITAIKKAESMSNKKPKQNWVQVLAASYAETGQGKQAIAMARKQLAADPGDATTRHNLIVLLLQANKNSEALKEMEQARSKGQLKTSASYMNLAKLYLNTGINSGKDPKPDAEKALAALKEGKAKGILKPNYDFYKLKGDAELVAGDRDSALKAYTKAASMGSSGYAELRRGELLTAQNKYSAARTAAHKALAKGLKHKGKAYIVIANAERGLKNKSAAIKAMKKAAQYPETREQATAWLKKSGH